MAKKTAKPTVAPTEVGGVGIEDCLTQAIKQLNLAKPEEHKKSSKNQKRFATVIQHFDEHYGQNESRLQSWQALCVDVGVEQGSSIKQCKRNLQGKYVNIVDFVNAKKNKQPVPTFTSRKALSNYIRSHPKKRFPKEQAKKNPILRWMLIQLC